MLQTTCSMDLVDSIVKTIWYLQTVITLLMKKQLQIRAQIKLVKNQKKRTQPLMPKMARLQRPNSRLQKLILRHLKENKTLIRTWMKEKSCLSTNNTTKKATSNWCRTRRAILSLDSSKSSRKSYNREGYQMVQLVKALNFSMLSIQNLTHFLNQKYHQSLKVHQKALQELLIK